MEPREIYLALDWAAAEGWNPGVHDGSAFYATDPGGFFIGLLDGEPIACISTVAYDESFGFLGFYIVRPEFRGKGFGLEIWRCGMEYLGDRNVGLDGVPEQQDNYQKSGFALAYRNIRYQGQSSSSGGEEGPGVVPLDGGHLKQAQQLDRSVFPAPREAFLRRWLTLPESHALGVEAAGMLTGYGVIRKCRDGYKIGPLVADSESTAEKLMFALASRVVLGTSVSIDAPEANPRATRLVERFAMQPVFETARMYTKGAPALALDNVYGVTTLELG
jgi:Acetyltransferase (GNAT) domain/Acetyltransferase (GNAT) family